MPERMEDPLSFSGVANNEMKTELNLIQNMINNLHENVHVDLSVNTRTNERGNSIWRMSQEFYSELYQKNEWSELIKSLRMADDEIHHLRFTNMYIEHHLNSYWEGLKAIKKDSNFISDTLNELSRFDLEFTRVVNDYQSSTVHEECKKEVKNVKFGKLPRKSKSAIDSVNKMCLSYGLTFDRKLPAHRDKLKRKKNFGKYCSLCGAVEVSSQNNAIRCRDCDGEIILQGLCSSCDSFKGRLLPKEKKFGDKPAGKKCPTCDVLRKKRICWDDKKICYKCQKGKNKTQELARVCEDKYDYPNAIAPKVINYVEPSSCCSDCDLTSSCDASLSGYKRKYRGRNLSADSLVPLSDSDNLILNVRSHSQDYDVSSSISSSTTEIRKGSFKTVGSISSTLKATKSAHEPLARVTEETVSVDDDFSSPREYFSAEDITLEGSDCEPPKETNFSDCQNNKNQGDDRKVICGISSASKSTLNSDEYEEAVEPFDIEEINDLDIENVVSPSKILLDDVVGPQPDLPPVSYRLHRAEEALARIAEEGTKLEAGISAMEDITHQNWKLSLILQEIMLDIASQLDYIHCSSVNKETFCPEEESDNEYEEALEDLHSSIKADSDVEIFYDIPNSNRLYFCLECGIETSYESLIKCRTCGRSLTEIPNGLFKEPLSFALESDSSKPLKNLSLKAFTPPSNHQKNEAEELSRTVFPVFVKGASSPFSLLTIENRLKQIQKEASLLNDNNDIINLFIDDLNKKTTTELKSIKNSSAVESGADPETTLFGFDLSIYQFRRLVTERMKNTETLVEANEEYEDYEEYEKEVGQRNRTFLEMKFEEVYKKEEQTALELEIFEQKLEVEGLIIKEMEEYLTSYTSFQTVQELEGIMTFPQRPFTSSRRSTSEKFHILKTPTKNDELMISIEIELENESKDNEKKAIRCEYKANLQKNMLKDQSYTKKSENERLLPTVALYPMWTSSKQDRRVLNRELPSQNEQMTHRCSSRESEKLENLQLENAFTRNEPYITDIEQIDLVELKAPNFFFGSSDEETESCAGESSVEKYRKTFHSVAAVRLPIAMYPITEIRLTETPFAILNSCKQTTCQKREFSRISQVELEVSPQSGVVLLQTEAVSSVGISECPSTAEGSFEEFIEIKSHAATSDMSFHRSGRSTWGNGSIDSILWKEACSGRKSSCLVKFIPVNMGGSSVASIALPDESLPVLTTENVIPIEEPPIENQVNTSSQLKMEEQELVKALSLIREIENDVVEVKLHNAVAILPQLESILREHLQQKIEVLKKKSSTMSNASLDVFMSSLNFITDDTEVSVPSKTDELEEAGSDERLGKMLQLLTGLEQAVKQINTTEENDKDCRNTDAGRICDLLKALSGRIKCINDEASVSEMEKTLELTSELDIAVRNYSSELHKNISGNSQSTSEKKLSSVKSSSDFIAANKIKMTKKKIFEAVAAEAQEREARVERGFDRIVRLENENAEVMKFLDTLLDKTLIRVSELEETKEMAFTLSRSVNELIQTLNVRTIEAMPVEYEKPPPRIVKIGRSPVLPSIQEVSSDNRTSESGEDDKSENMKNTLGDMITALDNLKSKAAEKKKKYKEIFGEEGGFIAKPLPVPGKSNSSQTKEDGSANITQFNKIGANTYYMAWSKPEMADESSTITGYEIWVNGRVNQRVRNPERLKAVLYSVKPVMETESLKIKLFALTDSNRRLFLADLMYP